MNPEKNRKASTRSPESSCPENINKKVRGAALFAALGYLLVFIFLSAGPAAAKIIDQVVATVNEDLITQSELNEGMELYMHQLDKAHQHALSDFEKKSLERRMLEEIIDKKLMENYAKEIGVGATEEEVDRAIQDVLTRADITKQQLQAALERDGIRYEEYRDQLRNQIVKAKLIHREIGSRIDIRDVEIEGYYLDHPEEFKTEEGVSLSHILIPLPPNADARTVKDAQTKALEIRKEIEAGMPFEEAAAKHSRDGTAIQGGRLGFFRKGDMNPEMEQAVWSLKEGEVSQPVRSHMGIHLIKVDEKTSGAPRPLEKVKESIREKLYEEQAERQFEDWRKDLRKKAHIEVFL